MKNKTYWHWCVRFIAINTFISCLISLLYMATPSTFPDNLGSAIFTLPYFIGHFGLLMILLFSPVILPGTFLNFKVLAFIASLYAAFLQTLLLVDTFVYQQYRFHINLFVLDLFFNGKGQIISFSWYLWLLVIVFVVGLFTFQAWVNWSLNKKLQQPAQIKNTGKIISVWFLCLLFSHLTHIVADGMFYRPITKLAFLPPFAIPANAQGTLMKYGLVDVEKHKSQALMTLKEEEASTVAYPLQTLKCQNNKPKLNVLFVIVDSLRYDHLSAEVMPNTYRLSEKSVVFNQHFSGSNSTRGGVFSFFYGLPPLYFEKFREGHVAPVLMNLLQEHHYQMGIFSSAPLTKPEFDQTVFANIPNLRKQSKAQPAYLRDQEITDEWLHFIEKHSPEKPFFGFLFYDSAHEFSHTPGYTPFKPYLEVINYFSLNNSTDPTLFLNRYKNSVHFIDSEIGRVIQQLENYKLLENTVVIFSSDHGKEFNDNKLNYWGHNSNFTNPQTQVPFFVYWPGKAPKAIEHWTAHYDVPSTLAEEIFGCTNEASNYSSGDNLFKHKGHEWILHGTYGDFGIRMPDHFIVIKNTGGYEILDHHYKPVDKADVPIETYKKALSEMRRFYK